MKKNIRPKNPNNLYSKLNQVLVFLFLLFLPTQLGRHFFLSFSFVNGVRVDYLAPTLYLTDVLAVLLLLFNLKQVWQFLKQKKVLFILGLLLINIIFSFSKPIASYRFIKIIEFLLILAIFKKQIRQVKLMLFGFLTTAVVELFLAGLQLINKTSVQGVFYFLGERYFSLSTPGVAAASFNGLEILRPYATFSHPNSLAGFYLLVYFFVLTNKKFNRRPFLKYFSLFIFSCLVFISFSKVAIATYILLNLAFLMLNNIKNCRLCFASRLFIYLALGLIFLSPSSDPTTLGKRLELLANSLTIIIQHPWFGVGIGNYLLAQGQFVSKYPLFINQPVHNIFLLFLAENGLIISLIIFFVTWPFIKKVIKNNPWVILVVVLTGFFDHYWLTLQQNFLLLPAILSFF